jgi:hypothetical protein
VYSLKEAADNNFFGIYQLLWSEFVIEFLKNSKSIWIFRSELGKKNALILLLFKFDRACRGGHEDIISRLLELKKQLEVDLDNRLGIIHLLRKHLQGKRVKSF